MSKLNKKRVIKDEHELFKDAKTLIDDLGGHVVILSENKKDRKLASESLHYLKDLNENTKILDNVLKYMDGYKYWQRKEHDEIILVKQFLKRVKKGHSVSEHELKRFSINITKLIRIINYGLKLYNTRNGIGDVQIKPRRRSYGRFIALALVMILLGACAGVYFSKSKTDSDSTKNTDLVPPQTTKKSTDSGVKKSGGFDIGKTWADMKKKIGKSDEIKLANTPKKQPQELQEPQEPNEPDKPDAGVKVKKEKKDLKIGQTCDENEQCKTKVCRYVKKDAKTMTCMPIGAEDPCTSNSDCLSKKCVNKLCAKSNQDGACVVNVDCVAGLYCEYEVGMCFPKKTEGGSCTAFECAEGYLCHEDKTCHKKRGLGESCEDYDCKGGLDCSEGKCVSLEKDDTSCKYDDDCDGLRCIKNNCRVIDFASGQTVDGTCDTDSDCLVHMYCDNNLCTR